MDFKMRKRITMSDSRTQPEGSSDSGDDLYQPLPPSTSQGVIIRANQEGFRQGSPLTDPEKDQTNDHLYLRSFSTTTITLEGSDTPEERTQLSPAVGASSSLYNDAITSLNLTIYKNIEDSCLRIPSASSMVLAICSYISQMKPEDLSIWESFVGQTKIMEDNSIQLVKKIKTLESSHEVMSADEWANSKGMIINYCNEMAACCDNIASCIQEYEYISLPPGKTDLCQKQLKAKRLMSEARGCFLKMSEEMSRNALQLETASPIVEGDIIYENGVQSETFVVKSTEQESWTKLMPWKMLGYTVLITSVVSLSLIAYSVLFYRRKELETLEDQGSENTELGN